MWVYPTAWTPSEEQYEEDAARYDDFEPVLFLFYYLLWVLRFQSPEI